MDSTQRIKTAAAVLMVGILLAGAFAASARAASGLRDGLTAKQWSAVQARARATDRSYRIGKYNPAAVGEKQRAVATDRYYHLGRYAVIAASNPFQWSDAGIGAGAMLGAVLVLGGLAVTLRRRGKPSILTTS